jgi:ATP synthase protein I
MADDAGKQKPPSLEEFSKRLDAVRGAPAGAKTSATGRGAEFGRAFRVGSELLAALAVGTFLGWGLDRVFGTTPWILLAGIFIGFAAGVLNVARALKQENRPPGGE